jgi:hypothetical protein
LFDGTAWRDVQQVITVRNAALEPTLSSSLLVANGELAFAFPFDGFEKTKSNAPGNQGVILLRRRQRRWIADTLNTSSEPNYVRLAAGPDSGVLTVAIVQPYYAERRSWASSLFLAQYDSSWHSPTRIAGDGTHPVYEPSLIVRGRRVLATWANDPSGTGDSTSLEWTTFRGTAQYRVPRRLASGTGVEDYDVVALDERLVIWFVRSGTSRKLIKVVLSGDSTMTELQDVPLPLDSPAPRAVAMSSTDVFIVSSGLAATPSEPAASTFITRLRLKCSGK